jgi:site-specific DNA-methyltransferase (cytosine-N4-specific)
VHNGHKARFSEELVRIPILTTTPPGGVVLDPFKGLRVHCQLAVRPQFKGRAGATSSS